jgi:Tetracyclin repressor-like, C-terminal domain
MVGIAMLRYVIKIPPLAAATDEEIVALVAPALQSYLVPS